MRHFLEWAGVSLMVLVAHVRAEAVRQEQEQFEVLQNCVFVANAANDGDSFHVSHGGVEYFFRLYYVDSPESDDRLGERIAEQAKVFGLTPAEVLQAGKKAKKFTADELSRGKFTVHTKWKDAKGASGMKRYFAFVKKNHEDYAQTLVENGWARVYGASDTTPDGKSVNETYGKLKALQRKAKAARKGVWTSKNAHNLPEE